MAFDPGFSAAEGTGEVLDLTKYLSENSIDDQAPDDADTGEVTLTQSRSVVHDDVFDPEETGAAAATLASAGLITLTATITDGDLDTDEATADLGRAITSEDAGDYRVEVSNGAGSIVSETVAIAVSGEVTGYEGWQLAHWAETPTVPESEPTADPDRDGKSNLEEYYLGTNPLEPDLGVGPVGSVEETEAGTILTVRFLR